MNYIKQFMEDNNIKQYEQFNIIESESNRILYNQIEFWFTDKWELDCHTMSINDRENGYITIYPLEKYKAGAIIELLTDNAKCLIKEKGK